MSALRSMQGASAPHETDIKAAVLPVQQRAELASDTAFREALRAKIERALEPLYKALQQFQQEVQLLRQEMHRTNQHLHDRFDRALACNRNSQLCIGPGKGHVAITWPQVHGKPFPTEFNGQERPANRDAVQDCPIAVVDAMLQAYGLPYGPAAGDDGTRRRSLLLHVDVF